MKRFVQDASRTQGTLLPDNLDDYVADTNPVRVADVFVDERGLGKPGFEGVAPAATGRQFKAVNNRDRNFTRAKLQRRMEEIESSLNRTLTDLITADRQEPVEEQARNVQLQDK